jgi:hypothetical protein
VHKNGNCAHSLLHRPRLAELRRVGAERAVIQHREHDVYVAFSEREIVGRINQGAVAIEKKRLCRYAASCPEWANNRLTNWFSNSPSGSSSLRSRSKSRQAGRSESL